jgi:hypothetical protein
MQSGDAPSSMSERFFTDGRLRLSGRNDARCTGCRWIRGTRAIKPSVPCLPTRRHRQSRTLRSESGTGRRSGLVSVVVSFVVVRGGSVTPADGRVEHVADADDRA